MVSNCLCYALGRYWREGGCVLMLQSAYGWWPHFVWTADMKTLWEFYPTRITKYPRYCPPWVFRGEPRKVSYDLPRALYRSTQRKQAR